MSENEIATHSSQNLEKVPVEQFQEVLSVGSKLRMAFTREAGGMVVNTEVLSHHQEVFFVAGLPNVAFPLNSLVQVSFATKKALYSFIARLMRTDAKQEGSSKAIFVLKRPGAWNRVQRRENFRVDMRIPVTLRPEKDLDFEINGESLNISASGMLVALDQNFEKGMRFQIEFELNKEEEPGPAIQCRAEVTRKSKPKGIKKGLYLHGLHFLDLTEKDADQLAQELWRHSKGKALK